MTDTHPQSSRFTMSRRRFVTSAAAVAGAAGLGRHPAGEPGPRGLGLAPRL